MNRRACKLRVNPDWWARTAELLHIVTTIRTNSYAGIPMELDYSLLEGEFVAEFADGRCVQCPTIEAAATAEASCP